MLKSVPNKSALSINDFIHEEITLTHGCPDSILSDNGREYKNSMVGRCVTE